MIRSVGAVALLGLALASCSHNTVVGLDGLSFAATAAVLPPPTGNVQTTATVTNESSGTIDLHYGACAVSPIFHTGSLDGPVVYDPRPVQACILILLGKTLAPGETLTLMGYAAPNLPPGKYFVSAAVDLNGVTTTIGAGMVTF
jgi:hypothetical protein